MNQYDFYLINYESLALLSALSPIGKKTNRTDISRLFFDFDLRGNDLLLSSQWKLDRSDMERGMQYMRSW